MDQSKLCKLLKEPTDFFKYWNKEIWCDDSRSKTMPSIFKATVVGIKIDSVMLRHGNNITDWYPLHHSRVSFCVDNK